MSYRLVDYPSTVLWETIHQPGKPSQQSGAEWAEEKSVSFPSLVPLVNHNELKLGEATQTRAAKKLHSALG
jgi:hypothetical protein